MSVNVFSTKVLIGDTIFTSPNGDGTAILLGHHFKTLTNGPAPGFEPATSRSAVKRSTDWANPATVNELILSQFVKTVARFIYAIKINGFFLSSRGELLLSLMCTRRNGETDYFFPELRVHIKDNNNSPHGKFHRFLFPFSSKFPHLNFAPYVLYIYSCYETRTWHKQWAWVTCGLISPKRLLDLNNAERFSLCQWMWLFPPMFCHAGLSSLTF